MYVLVTQQKKGTAAKNVHSSKSKSRQSRNFLAPNPTNIIIHYCCANYLYGVRMLLQLIMVLNKMSKSYKHIDQKDDIKYFASGTIMTNFINFYHDDDNWNSYYTIVCTCNN